MSRAIYSAFKTLRASGKIGLISREIVNGWLVAFVGDLAVTLVVFTGEPTTEQVRRVEDIHRVFRNAPMGSRCAPTRPSIATFFRSGRCRVDPPRAVPYNDGLTSKVWK
ncbi:MAG: hypothetical protein HND48_13125 [Chloroflexi bacterium]|nr:hypothetical protein [Chloroflexota bacterium]